MNSQPESPATVDPELEAQRQKMERLARDQAAHSLCHAIQVLVHGHPYDSALSALASSLVGLGAATVGFEATIQILVDARLALVAASERKAAELAAIVKAAEAGPS